MIDLPAIKARLNDPRELARLLGLRVMGLCAGGVKVQCPIHGSKGGKLALRNNGGTLQARCFVGCFGVSGLGGDVFTLLQAIEGGDWKRGMARAVELAGGVVGPSMESWAPAPRLDPDVYHELATRILDAGYLDRREWTLPIQDYLGRRGLLEQARGEGWASRPQLDWLLDLARDVYRDEPRKPSSDTVPPLTPAALLIAAKLAQYNRHGELVPYFGTWSLVIPWRGPDGRICALQRRRTWEHKPKNEDDPEPPKYVLPWAPDWPYGSERLGSSGDKNPRWYFEHKRITQVEKSTPTAVSVGELGICTIAKPIMAIVEGAVDTLALRSLYPRLTVIGVPGISGWRASWAGLVAGRVVRVALDRGKPGRDGIIPEDRAAARIALDCAGHPATDDVIEWLGRRHKTGRSLFCVLCGAAEPWLCGACGRRRARSKDWGEEWATRL